LNYKGQCKYYKHETRHADLARGEGDYGWELWPAPEIDCLQGATWEAPGHG